jgi:hypothetical protein
MTTAIATIKLAKQAIVRESTYGTRDLGKHASTMTLHCEKSRFFIEWDFPSLETTEHIGLEMEGKRVVGYDGVMSFPRPAYKWLRSLGYTIARDVV